MVAFTGDNPGNTRTNARAHTHAHLQELVSRSCDGVVLLLLPVVLWFEHEVELLCN